MTSSQSCPQCGRELPSDAPSGVCPQCLLGVGMQAAAPDDTFDRASNFNPPKPHELAPHFPQLDILDLAGQGGMGAVYKARQRGLDRLVALKILPPEVAKDPSFEERFAREARALAKLSHPNIVGVHDSGNAGGLFYVLMEFVDGVNLRDAIQTGEFTPEEALAIVPQICEALQYAHDSGVVHRDIKPENILLDKKGTVKIADFGLARLLGRAADNFTLTGTNQVMGTPRYMAPEQMEGSHEVDHRADIFSLGVVFYEMLTGELPLGRFDAPSKKVRVDVRLDEIVLRTLEKEPDRRYQTASAIKTDVETVYGQTHAPPHAHYYGYEYRSKTEVFGWPLVHVCHGIDPRTGRQRVAKGVIAIGGVAVGGFAFGGVAFGVFTFGGASVGLMSFGGAAVGLLVAIGGAAVGLGLSFGGLAIGTVAIGGGAFGVWGMGDQGAVVHRLEATDNVRQALAVAVLAGTSLGLVFVGLVTAFARRRSQRGGKPLHTPPHVPPRQDRRPVQVGCIFATLLVLLALLCVIPGALFWSYSSVNSRAVAEHARVRIVEVRDAQASYYTRDLNSEVEAVQAAGNWRLTEAGPILTTNGENVFKLSPDQIAEVNVILQGVYQDYLEVEKQHTSEGLGELNHVVTIVEPFTNAEIAKLEDKLWSQLDALVNVEQQKIMRLDLGVHVGEVMLRISDRKWKPGILGWGRHGCEIELWKVGTWYHWKARIMTDRSHVTTAQDSAPELPDELQRFWREPLPEESDGTQHENDAKQPND